MQRGAVVWRKPRLVCAESECPQLSFTEMTTAVPPHSRPGSLTAHRSDRRVEPAVAEVADAHGVGWHPTHTLLITAAAHCGCPHRPRRRCWVASKTRARRVRRVLEPHWLQAVGPVANLVPRRRHHCCWCAARARTRLVGQPLHRGVFGSGVSRAASAPGPSPATRTIPVRALGFSGVANRA